MNPKRYYVRFDGRNLESVSVQVWTCNSQERLTVAAYQVSPFEEGRRLVVGKCAEEAKERCLKAIRLSLLRWERSLDLGLRDLGEFEATSDLLQFVDAYMGHHHADAIRLAEPFVRQRLPDALYMQGMLDVHGLTDDSIFSRGLQSLRQAAAQGDAGALEALHSLYLIGRPPLVPSKRRARAFIRRALTAGLEYHPAGWISREDGQLVRLTKADIPALWAD